MRIFWTQAALDRYVLEDAGGREILERLERAEAGAAEQKMKSRAVLKDFARLLLATAEAFGVSISGPVRTKITRRAIDRYFRQRGRIATRGKVNG